MLTLDEFDAHCRSIRTLLAETNMRRKRFDRHFDALEKAFLAWIDSGGPEPTKPEDDPVVRMLSTICDVARMRYANAVHELLLPTSSVMAPSLERLERELRERGKFVLDMIAEQAATMCERPVRMKWSDEYPECLNMIVFGDLDPARMSALGAYITSISSGTLRFCANIIDPDDALLQLCNAGRVDEAFQKSWDLCFATVRHEEVP